MIPDVASQLPALSFETAAPPPARTAPAWLAARYWALHDVWVLTRRTLARVITTPEQLVNVTVQPLILVLLFSYVFDGAIRLPDGGNYREYLIAGIFAVNMGGTAQGTAIGLAVDLSTGLIDRFRSLPMSRATVLIGRTLADLSLTLVAGLVTAMAGLAGARRSLARTGRPRTGAAVRLFRRVGRNMHRDPGPRRRGRPGGRADGHPAAVTDVERFHLGQPDDSVAA